jgi:legumain
MKFLALAVVLCLALSVQADNWAVLVAGSNGFWNYRHQADICHAYQILIQNGYKPENIITFSYDDVANASQNPFKGKLYNKPTGDAPGVDVYAGCVVDYKGADVTPKNFLAALRGDSAAVGGKKVLKSTSDDRVFINFSDHGAPGLIAFPTSYLYAK